jgi:hypothetical protein
MKITRSKAWYAKSWKLCYALAWAMCILPTLIISVAVLPKIVITESATQTLSGTFILAIICAAYPIFKGLLKYMKSPSAWLILWILTAFTYVLLKISHQSLTNVFIVLLTAAIGNTFGALLFFAARVFKEKWKFCGEVNIKTDGV